MTKITPEHLTRGAYIYIRQSTADQLMHNHESRRRQYGLADRARQLGWQDVVVIDDDLGRSGSGISRPGFERLLAAICEGRVGAVFAVEVSRLARNGRDWHTLIEFCGLVGTIIVDEDGVYDPRHPNDRLLLGMKGTMSELELSILRQRSLEALKQKARRGELFLTVAIGYVKLRHNRIDIDPDTRVREAIQLVFRKFGEFQSIRQVHLWIRQEGILLPAVNYTIDDWEVLITDHHDGYLSWAEFERNQRLIADNATSKGMMARGAVRRGETLLAGLLRCGHCGRKLHVAYGGSRGEAGRYHCQGAHINHGGDRCISFGSLRVDQAVGAEVLRLLKPLGVEAALNAVAARTAEVAEKRQQMELALQQARYEANHARRQYDAVDPDNRLVAGELERRWNETLLAVRHLEDQLAAIASQKQPALSDAERERLMQLVADLELAWSHPAATTATRKRIVRAVLHEIVARLEEGHVVLVLHWQGGDHSQLKVKKNTAGKHRWTLDEETGDLIRGLARLLPDKAIASLLNRSGKVTGRNNSWTQSRVCTFRNQHDIAVYRDGERAERGELTLEEAAASLGVSPMTALRMIRSGILDGHHLCKGAPWVIPAQSVEHAKLPPLRFVGQRPLTENPDQKVLAFQ